MAQPAPPPCLPSRADWDSDKYPALPGPYILKKMQPIFAAQRSEMHTTSVKSGVSNTTTRMSPEYEERFTDDHEAGMRFAMEELIANTFDVSVQAGLLNKRDLVCIMNEATKAASR